MILKFIKEHQLLIVGLILAIGILLMYNHRSDPKPDRSGEIAAKEELAKAYREAMLREREISDQVIADSRRKDSLLAVRDKVQTVKYATIPVYIRTVPKDSLANIIRRELAGQ